MVLLDSSGQPLTEEILKGNTVILGSIGERAEIEAELLERTGIEADAHQAKVIRRNLAEASALKDVLCAAAVMPESILPLQVSFSTNGKSKVGLDSDTVKYALQIFEGMKAIRSNGKLYLVHPDDNFDRMRASAELMHFPFSYSNGKLIYTVVTLLLMNDHAEEWPKVKDMKGILKDASIDYVRPHIVAPLDSLVGIGREQYMQTSIQILPMGLYFDEEQMRNGFNVFFDFTDIKPSFATSEDFSVKAGPTYMWAGCIERAKTRGMQNVVETVIINNRCVVEGGMVMKEEYLKEGSSDTVAIIRGDTIICPPLSTGRLNGTTIRMVEKIAGILGITFEYRDIHPDEILKADGIMLFGNAVNMLGVDKGFFVAEEMAKRGFAQGEQAKEHSVMKVDIFGKETELWGYSFNTTANPIYQQIARAFEIALTSQEFGNNSLCINDLLVPNAIEIMREYGKETRGELEMGLESLKKLLNVIKRDAELSSSEMLYPAVGRREVDRMWQRAFRRQAPVAAMDGRGQLLRR